MEQIEIRKGRGRLVNLKDKIGFGKYRDRKVKWVIDNDYDYLSWCIDKNILLIDQDCEKYISLAVDSYISEVTKREND